MKKTHVLSEPVSPEVAAFCVLVERKLQKEGYPDKESWEGFSITFLLRQLESKVKELRTLEGRPAELFAKSIVIGTLTTMLVELSAKQAKQEKAARVSDRPGALVAPHLALCANGTSRGGQE